MPAVKEAKTFPNRAALAEHRRTQATRVPWQEDVKAQIDRAYGSTSGISDNDLIAGLEEIADYAKELADLRNGEVHGKG